MLTVDFSLRSADNLVYRDIAALTVISPGQRFSTPEEFVEESLGVFLNGVMLDRVSDNGFNVLSPNSFELKQSISNLGTRHAFFVSYLKA